MRAILDCFSKYIEPNDNHHVFQETSSLKEMYRLPYRV